MVQTPYLVYGIIQDKDALALGSGIVVTVTDTTLGESITSTSNSEGKYIIDLANLTSDYTVGDVITVSYPTTTISSYVPNATTATSSSTIGSGGGEEIDVTDTIHDIDYSTLRTDIWDLFKKLLIDGYYEIDTDNIHAAMNDAQISSEGYPQIIIYTPSIDSSSLDFKKELGNKSINMMIEIYHNSAESLKALTDQIENKIETAELNGVFDAHFIHNLDMPDNSYDWWTDAKKKIHRATLNANFTYIGRR